MKKIIFALLTFSVLLLVGCPEETGNTDTKKKNEPYREGQNFFNYQYNPDHTEDILDVYRAADEKRPAVMLLHGGAWITVPGLESILGRAGMESFKDLFLKNGYHVVNVDYRLIKFMNPDGTNYKDMLDDVKSAVQYIKDNADTYKIDTSKIIMYGYSAGAHLAELYSYKVTDSPIPVKLCVGRAGPADFWNEEFRTCDVFGGFSGAIPGATETDKQAFSDNFKIMIKGLLGNPPDLTDDEIEGGLRVYLVKNLLGITEKTQDVTTDINEIVNNAQFKSIIDDVSPITHVSANSPKTILLHGKQDHLVDISMAESLETKLKANNVQCEFIKLEYSDHGLNDERDKDKLDEFNTTVQAAITQIKEP